MKKKTIAFVSDAIYPYNKGGKEKWMYEFSTRLAAKGYDVHVYCMKWWQEKELIKQEDGVTLHAISPLYPLYSGERRSIRQAILFALSCFKLIKENFDIIEVDHMPHLVLFVMKIVCILKQKKLIATWNEVWGREYWQKYLGSLGIIAYGIEWFSAQLPDEIVSISEQTKKRLQDVLRVKVPIHVVTPGIDIALIEKIASAKTPSDIIFAGRLLENKHIDVLVKAVALLTKKFPLIRVIIVGKGPEKAALQTLIMKSGLAKNITMIDFLEKHEDLYALMKASKVFVFPSTREGFGIVALEANACNLPVITTNHIDNAAKDLITDGQNGYAVSLSEKNIAEKVATYLETKGKKKNYTEYVKAYDWNYLTTKIMEIYRI